MSDANAPGFRAERGGDDRSRGASDPWGADADELVAALRSAAELRQIEGRRAALAPRLGEVRARVRSLRIRLARETADVREAEAGGLKLLLDRVLGRADERAAKARADVVRAKIRLDAATAELAAAEAEDAAAAARIAALGDVGAAVDAARALREVRLRERDPAARARLGEIDAALAEMAAVGKEIDEAIAAASDAMDALGAVARSLERARNHGTCDVLGFGPGFAKFSELDDANAAASRAYRALERMNREIRDVAGVRSRARSFDDVRVHPALRFLDLFADNVVTDLFTQTRIAQTSGDVQESRLAVVEAFGVLRERRALLDARARELGAERLRLVDGR